MDELLTVKDVEDLLKIDRITVYRMLKDGRLTGVKVGAHWRFARRQIDALLQAPPAADPPAPTTAEALPLHCAQLIQNIFAEVAEVGVLTTTPRGEPLTATSRPCRFCELIRANPAGRRGCVATWRRAGPHNPAAGQFITCHAGLQCTGAPVVVDGLPIATVIAGQFYAAPPHPAEEAHRLRNLTRHYGLDLATLEAAARDVPVLDARKREQLPGWVASVASTFAAMSRERAALLDRLHSIAAMSTLEES